jgi:alpha,alpha-trehalase
MQVLERNFEKTGVLWEKYSVETGEVSHMEYESPPMMGWTAGVYRYFQEEKNKNKERGI